MVATPFNINPLHINLHFVKTIIYLFFAAAFSGCGFIYKTKYHLSKPFAFYYKGDYIRFLENKKWFRDFECLYLDSASYFRFIGSDKVKSGNIVLQGLYLNDSTEVKSSDEYEQKKYCSGAIISEIKKLTNGAHHSLLFSKANCKLSEFQFYKLSNNILFEVEEANSKIKIILGYSYALGSYYDKLFTDIRNIANHHKMQFEVYVICLDPIYKLK
jgi:hypothetical protein